MTNCADQEKIRVKGSIVICGMGGGAPPGGRTTLDVLRMGGELFWTSRQGGANIFGLPKTQFFHVLWVFWALLIFW